MIVLIMGLNHLLDCDTIFVSKFMITLVMGRNTHHRTCAITHQYKVCDPDRNGFTRNRMHSLETGIHPPLLHQGHIGLFGRDMGALFQKLRQFRPLLR